MRFVGVDLEEALSREDLNNRSHSDLGRIGDAVNAVAATPAMRDASPPREAEGALGCSAI